MSDLSDKKPAVTESIGATVADLGASSCSAKGKPVQIWAVIRRRDLGSAVVRVDRWVTGPYFEQVPAGPTPIRRCT